MWRIRVALALSLLPGCGDNASGGDLRTGDKRASDALDAASARCRKICLRAASTPTLHDGSRQLRTIARSSAGRLGLGRRAVAGPITFRRG